MFERFTSFFKRNEIYGIEVTHFENGNLRFQHCKLKRENGEISLVESGTGVLDSDLQIKKVEVPLVINTKQVLTKVLVGVSVPNEALVENAFPNLDSKQFFVQSVSDENAQVVSIVRQQHVQELIETFKAKEIYITSIYLGNMLAFGMKKLTDINRFYTTNAQIELLEHSILKVKEVKQETYEIHDQKLTNQDVLSFLSGLQSQAALLPILDNFTEVLSETKKEFNQMQLFFYGLRGAIAILLIGLLINFFYFNEYYNFVKEHENTENTQLKAVLNPLKSQVDRLDKLTNQILENRGSSTSFLINDVIESLPESIKLSTLAFQPLAKRIRKNKPIELILNVITVKGNSYSEEAFANWNTEIERLEWVDKIVIKKFDAVASDAHEFELEIQLTP